MSELAGKGREEVPFAGIEINGGECWTYQTDDTHNGDGYFVSGTYGFENVSADPVNEEWTTMLNGAVLAVYTHELGHNIGAWHTFQNNTYNAQDEYDCTLNNVMGQDFAIIDLCASNLPSYGVTQEQWGTIMSYCDISSLQFLFDLIQSFIFLLHLHLTLLDSRHCFLLLICLESL